MRKKEEKSSNKFFLVENNQIAIIASMTKVTVHMIRRNICQKNRFIRVT
jgi:hypothetical protein